ncbi:RNA polymerase sigma factor [Pedobacter sp. GR22-6]|uniref:RNA polymerase sigma factor n=1 Tax=Pedobacter sp. GR22-6 TaxID=3127957 RepID=UPI00307D3831
MDDQVFLDMISEHQGIIHKVCRLYRDTPEDREDLFQEITYQLWKAFPGYRKEAKKSSWMYRIGLNTAISSFRKKRPQVAYESVLPDYPEEGQNEEQALRQERFFAILKELNDAEKAIITLYLEEHSYRQIADILGITESNVGVKLNRIKNKIQQRLSK